MKLPKIKICGLTRTEEAGFLNESKADYAGFVLYEKSKRSVTIAQAENIRKELSPEIRQVAVVVSPERSLCQELEQAGFDILQIHGKMHPELPEQSRIPIWRACNLKNIRELERLEHHENIIGYVADAGQAGGGIPFDWQNCRNGREWKERYFHGKTFVLAGGLSCRNVGEGIRRFHPDVADVSSGVESSFRRSSDNQEIRRKDRKLIFDFIKEVRGQEYGT